MKHAIATSVVAAALSAAACPWSVEAGTLGSVTLSNNEHWGYYPFVAGANNTRGTITGLSGTAKMIRVSGTLTEVHTAAWAKSLRTYITTPALAPTQPWWQYSNASDFTGTMNVDARIYIPNGGFDISRPITYDMFTIDSEQYTPGLDGRSTLTYTFEDSFAPGSVEFNGVLAESDPTFNRPMQTYSSAPSGYGSRYFSGRRPHYDVQPFYVSTTGTYAAASANEFESALLIYRNEFDPNMDALPSTPRFAKLDATVVAAREQTGNVLRNTGFNPLPYNDDAVGGSMIETTLTAGVQYFLVTSALNAVGAEGDGGPFVGRYSNVITGAGPVTLGIVPEPTTGLVVAALTGVVLRRRRMA